MRRSYLAVLLALVAPVLANAQAPNVQLVPKEAERRVDVLVDGKPFTAFLYPANLPKQVLYPIVAASGTPVTRGWPLEPRPGERVDHPHHIGLWFNHSDVNGLDFWNNSDAIPAAQKNKMGTIVFRGIDSVKSGKGAGTLVVRSDWVTPTGKTLLHETTRFVFRASGNARTIDRTTTLAAIDTTVTFHDNKDGTLGLRVRRELEQPADKPEVFTDGSGRATAVPVLNNEGVTGHYVTSEGVGGDSAWSTRAKWTTLSGTVKGEPITIAIIDHPKNYNFPTYWHARGYGLFAANPLGAKDFTKGQKVDDFKLAPGQSTTFRYRVVVLTGPTTKDQIEQQFKDFSK